MGTDLEELIIVKLDNGRGILANRNFESGEKILEFKGQILRREELPVPYSAVEDHYMQIGERLYLGPSGDKDDLINHSCQPNAGVKIRDKRVFLFSIKAIKKGEEITWDYSTTMDEDEWEMNCNCKSENCRRRIRDFNHLPKDLQQNYISLGIVPEFIIKSLQKTI